MKYAVLLLALFAVIPFKIAHAADFEVVYKSCPDDDGELIAKLRGPSTNCKASADLVKRGRVALRLVGDIAAGDADRLKTLLDGQVADVASYGYGAGSGSYVIVEMAGEAGSVDGALELGDFFNHNAVQTRIVNGATCAGPCALAFMGGRAQWGRLTRPAIDRRLEAGGQLVFRSPLYPPADAAANPEKLRGRFRDVQSYAVRADVAPLILAKILALKQDESFPIDSVFWAKVAGIAVDGVLPMNKPSDDDYISACFSQVDWTYGPSGISGEDFGLNDGKGEPPKLRDDQGNWEEGEVFYRGDGYVITAMVWSYARYDYWCALNTSRTKEVKIPRRKLRAVLSKWVGRNTLLYGNGDEDIDLKGNEIYSSKQPNDLQATRAQNCLDLLLRAPTTKLAAIADATYKWNPWSDADPWFEHDEP